MTRYNARVRLIHFLVALVYGTYLTYAGLLFLLVPWSPLWGMLIVRLPPVPGGTLGSPGFRGAVSAFGLLHFLVAALEIRNLFSGKMST